MVKHGALMHTSEDDVAVAIVDLVEGEEVYVMTIDGEEIGTIRVVENIPLGHKISMRKILTGSKVIKYGHSIGRATKNIPIGTHIHNHNIKSEKWS
jgi:(2R)-sulfolactate sulfo-lyase subunit alpha